MRSFGSATSYSPSRAADQKAEPDRLADVSASDQPPQAGIAQGGVAPPAGPALKLPEQLFRGRHRGRPPRTLAIIGRGKGMGIGQGNPSCVASQHRRSAQDSHTFLAMYPRRTPGAVTRRAGRNVFRLFVFGSAMGRNEVCNGS